MNKENNSGHTTRAVVVSAPSGGGKTTLNRRMVKEYPEVALSISHTTRSPRTGEKDGIHYHFIGEPQFRRMVESDQFLEWADVHGKLYGTSFGEIERLEAAGKIPILEIDVQGWENVRGRLDSLLSVFILPPSLRSLWQRLSNRDDGANQSHWLRLQNARDEIEKSIDYSHFIINDDLDKAYAELTDLIIRGQAPQLSREEGRRHAKSLKDEFDSAEWIKEIRRKA